ncbi:MAG: peptidoglycan-binding protein [Alphaproteobacteria bacterium]
MNSYRRRTRSSVNLWPGFVDALSSLLMIIIFVLMVFMVAQYYLGDLVQGQDKALGSLRVRISELAHTLGIETHVKKELQGRLAQIEADRTRLNARLNLTSRQLLDAKMLQANTEAQIVQLNDQLQRLNTALGVSQEALEQKQVEIDTLGTQLNEALTKKVEDLSRFRSEFFGLLREAIGARDDIQVVGDRFVFQSEVLFASGSASLGTEGKQQLKKLAATLQELSEKFPEEVDWILRIDGHTDNKPIRTARFKSNWELSFNRALSVVQFLAKQGVPQFRLAATGFGEFQPIDQQDLGKNRRIELRLDQR